MGDIGGLCRKIAQITSLIYRHIHFSLKLAKQAKQLCILTIKYDKSMIKKKTPTQINV